MLKDMIQSHLSKHEVIDDCHVGGNPLPKVGNPWLSFARSNVTVEYYEGGESSWGPKQV